MSAELSVYLKTFQDAAEKQQTQVKELQDNVRHLADVRALILRMPAKVRHDVMVPFTKHAFFPGQIVHTNEFMVHLGCEYQLEASAVEAEAVLARRQAKAEQALALAQRQLEELQGRIKELQADFSNEEGDQFLEIRQDFEESEELLHSAAASGARAGGAAGAAKAATERPLPPAAGPGKVPNTTRAGTDPEADAAEDARIFARLAALEQMEAEASASLEQDSDDDGGRPGSSGSSGGAAAMGAADSSQSTGADRARRQAKAPAASAPKLKKGFLLGASAGGSAGKAAKAAGKVAAKPKPAPDQGQGGNAGTSGSATVPAPAHQPGEGSNTGGQGAAPEPRSDSPRQRRRVSFADGIRPGEGGDEEIAEGCEAERSSSSSSIACGSPSMAGSGAGGDLPAGILRKGQTHGSDPWQEQQAHGGPQGREDLDAAAAATAGAAAAFTGHVLEHTSDDDMQHATDSSDVGQLPHRFRIRAAPGPAAVSGSSGASAPEALAGGAGGEGSGAPRKVSRFKAQRLGLA